MLHKAGGWKCLATAKSAPSVSTGQCPYVDAHEKKLHSSRRPEEMTDLSVDCQCCAWYVIEIVEGVIAADLRAKLLLVMFEVGARDCGHASTFEMRAVSDVEVTEIYDGRCCRCVAEKPESLLLLRYCPGSQQISPLMRYVLRGKA